MRTAAQMVSELRALGRSDNQILNVARVARKGEWFSAVEDLLREVIGTEIKDEDEGAHE